MPTTASAGNIRPQGWLRNCFIRFGWIEKLASDISSTITTEPAQHFAPNERDRSCKLPSAFSTTHRLPCTAKARNDAAPTSSVYQSTIPTSPIGEKFVHRGKKK